MQPDTLHEHVADALGDVLSNGIWLAGCDLTPIDLIDDPFELELHPLDPLRTPDGCAGLAVAANTWLRQALIDRGDRAHLHHGDPETLGVANLVGARAVHTIVVLDCPDGTRWAIDLCAAQFGHTDRWPHVTEWPADQNPS